VAQNISGIAMDIWYDPRQGGIHLTTTQKWEDGSPMFTSDDSGPGLHLIVNANPRSVDYNPRDYNRLARALRAAGKPAPAEDAPEFPRHLKKRPGVIAELRAMEGAAVSRADLAAFGWTSCSGCGCLLAIGLEHKCIAAGVEVTVSDADLDARMLELLEEDSSLNRQAALLALRSEGIAAKWLRNGAAPKWIWNPEGTTDKRILQSYERVSGALRARVDFD
jgi:hypothetical protein